MAWDGQQVCHVLLYYAGLVCSWNISMVAADVLAPNRRQAIDSHHADPTMNGVSHGSWYISHIYVAVFRQCWWDVGRSVTRWLFVITGSPSHSDNTLCTLLYFTLNVNQTPFYYYNLSGKLLTSQIAKFMGPTWGPSGSCRPQMGPMLAPWTLLLGMPSATLGGKIRQLLTRVDQTVFIRRSYISF